MSLGGADDPAALVLKIGRYPGHHGGLAVIRSLGAMGVDTYAVVEHDRAPAASSAYLAGAFVWPTGSSNATEKHLVGALEEMRSRLGRPTVVVPTDDRAATLLNRIRSRLPADLVLPDCAPGLAARLADKQSLAREAERAGLSMPTQTVLRCPLTTAEVASLPLPLILKRAEPGLHDDGSRSFSTLLVRDRAELAAVLQPGSAPFEVIVQEPIEGEDWLYHGYLDAGSRPVVAFTGRKVRSWPPYAGETAYGVATVDARLRDAAERFLTSVGYVGPVGLDVRLDRRTGTYRLLDANPRVCASFRLGVDAGGLDVVRAMYLDLAGRPVPRSDQVEGRTYMVENYDWLARPAYGSAGLVGAGRWLRTVSRVDERSWLRLADLRPVARRLGMARHASAARPVPADRPRFIVGQGRRRRGSTPG